VSRSEDLQKAQDARRRETSPWRKLYFSKAWKLRRALQFKVEPLCRKCKAMGKSRAATVADHVVPHRGNRELFFKGELQSLCATCHSSSKQLEEREGFSRDIGEDGWPVDSRHIFFRRT